MNFPLILSSSVIGSSQGLKAAFCPTGSSQTVLCMCGGGGQETLGDHFMGGGGKNALKKTCGLQYFSTYFNCINQLPACLSGQRSHMLSRV
uniref:Uncharacterized protein n=1 Tax=Anguilla anguilla TaxID=7936 RepID=A0A0E9X1X8_ANGAN